MGRYGAYEDWSSLIEKLLLEGRSTAVGVFDLDGNMLDANQTMCIFWDASLPEKKPKNSFVNPEFSTFVTDVTQGLVFEGLLTVGNWEDISYTLEAKVFRRVEKILIFAEVDVLQLFVENAKMSRLNQEVNNLQRLLIKEKMTLQQTLNTLRETQLMLIHSEKMNAMGQLVAGVAHEINNPISFVYSNLFSFENYIGDLFQSFSDLEGLIHTNCHQELILLADQIREKYDLNFLFDDISDLTKQSKTGLERIKKIVEDLRNFSRLDEAQLKQIDLISNLASTIAIAGLEFSKRNIRYQLIAPEKLMIECYPGQLNQALLNVILNGAQSIEKDGNMTIIIIEEGTMVKISVIDDGCGIHENIKGKIFDPFFTTKPVGSGTGLGLSITYKIINELHKGTIQVDSTVGQGSCFSILIPKSQVI